MRSKFREYFKDYLHQYVFIGKTARNILMTDVAFPFKATKDLDMVLIVEAPDVSFEEQFWKFITALKEELFNQTFL
jgi:hypothetical protein